jgi:hypothetical protein
MQAINVVGAPLMTDTGPDWRAYFLSLTFQAVPSVAPPPNATPALPLALRTSTRRGHHCNEGSAGGTPAHL